MARGGPVAYSPTEVAAYGLRACNLRGERFARLAPLGPVGLWEQSRAGENASGEVSTPPLKAQT